MANDIEQHISALRQKLEQKHRAEMADFERMARKLRTITVDEDDDSDELPSIDVGEIVHPPAPTPGIGITDAIKAALRRLGPSKSSAIVADVKAQIPGMTPKDVSNKVYATISSLKRRGKVVQDKDDCYRLVQ